MVAMATYSFYRVIIGKVKMLSVSIGIFGFLKINIVKLGYAGDTHFFSLKHRSWIIVRTSYAFCSN